MKPPHSALPGDNRATWATAFEAAQLIKPPACGWCLTQGFPNEEKFGLVSQMRRAAVSIPSNIAEGQARHTTQEFVQFVSHAEGSVAELDMQLTLALELGFCPEARTEEASGLLSDLRKMLNALRRVLVSSRK